MLYSSSASQLAVKLQRLEKLIAANGVDDVSLHTLFASARYRQLLLQINSELERIAPKSSERVILAKTQGIQYAVADSVRIGAKLGIEFNRLNTGALEQMAFQSRLGTPLSDRFMEFGTDAAEEIRRRLFNAVALGQNADEAGREIATSISDMIVQNAVTIARTEMFRAYRITTTEQYRYNSDVIYGWKWICSKSVRTCPLCLAMDGSDHSLSEQLDTHPSCRCTQVPLIRGYDLDYGINGQTYFDSLDDVDRVKILDGSQTLFNLLNETDLRLADLPQYHNTAYGPMLGQKSFRQLVASEVITPAQLARAQSLRHTGSM